MLKQAAPWDRRVFAMLSKMRAGGDKRPIEELLTSIHPKLLGAVGKDLSLPHSSLTPLPRNPTRGDLLAASKNNWGEQSFTDEVRPSRKALAEAPKNMYGVPDLDWRKPHSAVTKSLSASPVDQSFVGGHEIKGNYGDKTDRYTTLLYNLPDHLREKLSGNGLLKFLGRRQGPLSPGYREVDRLRTLQAMQEGQWRTLDTNSLKKRLSPAVLNRRGVSYTEGYNHQPGQEGFNPMKYLWKGPTRPYLTVTKRGEVLSDMFPKKLETSFFSAIPDSAAEYASDLSHSGAGPSLMYKLPRHRLDRKMNDDLLLTQHFAKADRAERAAMMGSDSGQARRGYRSDFYETVVPEVDRSALRPYIDIRNETRNGGKLIPLKKAEYDELLRRNPVAQRDAARREVERSAGSMYTKDDMALHKRWRKFVRGIVLDVERRTKGIATPLADPFGG